MPKDWGSQEVALIIADYFTMLQLELQRHAYSKKAHRLALLPQLQNRTEGSLEFKHQNISAVLSKLGEPYIKGYKPRGNYQQMLEDDVIRFLELHETVFEPLFTQFAAEDFSLTPTTHLNFAHCKEPAPLRSPTAPEVAPTFRPIKVNYLQKEQNNRNLGAAGEQFVMDYEKWRLAQAGRSDLAACIQWVASEQGDGAGYDILSKNIDGSDRYIEVKTTKLGKETPIYLTATEIAFAAQHAANFYLYRVFDFAGDKKLFIQSASYDQICQLVPITFKGIF